MEDWYNVTWDTISKHGGTSIIFHYGTGTSTTTRDSNSNNNNNNTEDNRTKKKQKREEEQGNAAASTRNPNHLLYSILRSIYPQYPWLPWRFQSQRVFEDKQTQRQYMDWLGKQLGVNVRGNYILLILPIFVINFCLLTSVYHLGDGRLVFCKQNPNNGEWRIFSLGTIQ